ncbi:MAG TPA: phage Gp37/Gp68 family protein [Rhizobiaceae bacterium]|nr:phage Gp37/Gp68 family protein [Rhizobiaceae bacterium]
MGEITAISWCDATFNPWIGCTKVSPACDGCYAEALMDKRYGRVEWGAPGKGNGTRVRTSASNWRQPIRWNKKAREAGTRPFVFCSSLADVFDNQVPTEWRRDLFELIIKTPHLVWLLLTKRPQNIVKLFDEISHTRDEWPRNAAIGTTIEDQKRADVNEPALVNAAAELNPAFTFVSCEPLLEGFRLRHLYPTEEQPRIDWVITGGETDQGGHKARPTHPDWYRSLRDQCAAAGVAYHHKQNGVWVSDDGSGGIDRMNQFLGRPEAFTETDEPVFRIGKALSGRLLDGIEHNARPEVA